MVAIASAVALLCVSLQCVANVGRQLLVQQALNGVRVAQLQSAEHFEHEGGQMAARGRIRGTELSTAISAAETSSQSVSQSVSQSASPSVSQSRAAASHCEEVAGQ